MLTGVNRLSRTQYGYGRALTVNARTEIRNTLSICVHGIIYSKTYFQVDSPKALVYWRHHQIHILCTEGMRKRAPYPRGVYLATRLTTQLFPGDLWVNVLFVACFRERSANYRCFLIASYLAAFEHALSEICAACGEG